jgi:hypothetical protein
MFNIKMFTEVRFFFTKKNVYRNGFFLFVLLGTYIFHTEFTINLEIFKFYLLLLAISFIRDLNLKKAIGMQKKNFSQVVLIKNRYPF